MWSRKLDFSDVCLGFGLGFSGLVASVWTAATVGGVPTVFVCWDIRLGRVVCILVCFVRFIVACLRFCGSLLSFTRVYLYY